MEKQRVRHGLAIAAVAVAGAAALAAILYGLMAVFLVVVFEVVP